MTTSVKRPRCTARRLTASIAVLLSPVLVLSMPEDDLDAGIAAYNQGDLIGAMALYRSAADAGLAEAQVRLAYILDYSEDDAAAVDLYRAAAEQRYADGYLGLAEMHVKGEGVEQDYAKAIELYTKAAENGSLRAMRILMRAHDKGEFGLEADASRAGEWLLRGAEAGDRQAITELIDAYQTGAFGMVVNEERASYWRQQLDPVGVENE